MKMNIKNYCRLVIILISIMVLFGCSIECEYKVTGSANTVDVTYSNESEGTSQESNVSIPWTYSFDGEEGQFVYISAQNQGETGSVTVTIYRNGKKIETSTSNGAYVIATASGSL